MHLSSNISNSPEDTMYNEEVFSCTKEQGEFVANEIRDEFNYMRSKNYDPDTLILGHTEYKKLICHLTNISGGTVIPTNYLGMDILVAGYRNIQLTMTNHMDALSWMYHEDSNRRKRVGKEIG